MRTLLCALMLLLLSPLAAVAAPGCQRLSFSGQVQGEQEFRQAIGMGLSFRMEVSNEQRGWSFEIGPTQPRLGEFDSYIYLLTPPWHGRPATAIDTTYAVLAQDAVSREPRRFWFLLRRTDMPAARAALEDYLWPSGNRAQKDALRKLGTFAMGAGILHVIDADIEPGSAAPDDISGEGDYGAIRRIAFKVELTVPMDFRPARKVKAAPVGCLDPTAWASEWVP
ncbi:hypothetical protein C3942_07240 [Solimonas fluminis]|uniref:Uncharacterized protein n=1 Tax=Solimonas fluminis TaxID=2086571 RepID=A0A2S5THW2_9GAMM|nr:hypothetical protein [Solimonas fluminis]PPE74551.1 hypothetical protein C3942_07240 [Solimonas fluminis]